MPVLYVSTDLQIWDNDDRDEGKVLWLAFPGRGKRLFPFYKLGPKYMKWIVDMVAELEKRVNNGLAKQEQLDLVVRKVEAIIEYMKSA